MGEAWFMGERRKLFVGLQAEPPPLAEAREALEEIASGTSCFGRRAEWHDWLHFLVPRLLPLCHAPQAYDLLELIVAAFVTQHPRGLAKADPGFRADRELAIVAVRPVASVPSLVRLPRK